MKILTIAIPTYNRSAILRESLVRLLSEREGMEDKIDILISDNNSDDDTRHVVEQFLRKGFNLIYNKNDTNLGMDGNFIYCFENAKSKYVWLLGDDDLVKVNQLKYILDLLEKHEPGLMHLNKNEDNESKGYRLAGNKTVFIRQISFWITFISSNIVKTEFVKTVNFEKYKGTYFTLIPVYLNAVISSSYNLYIERNILEDPLDQKRNGGYNIFEVFGVNYLKILKEYRGNFGWLWYEREKFLLLTNFFNNWIRRLIRDKNDEYNFMTTKWLGFLLINYWYEPYFYLYLLKIFFLRR